MAKAETKLPEFGELMANGGFMLLGVSMFGFGIGLSWTLGLGFPIRPPKGETKSRNRDVLLLAGH